MDGENNNPVCSTDADAVLPEARRTDHDVLPDQTNRKSNRETKDIDLSGGGCARSDVEYEYDGPASRQQADPFRYHGVRFRATVILFDGFQDSPFKDGTRS